MIKYLGDVPVIGTLFQGAPMGIGLFTAALILAIMIIPFIASVMRDVFEVTPTLLKESAYGLGSTTGKWCATWFCLIPAQAWWAASSWVWVARWVKPWP